MSDADTIVISRKEAHELALMLYRLLERFGAEADVLSVVGSLFDSLPVSDVTELGNDWLKSGQTIHPIQ